MLELSKFMLHLKSVDVLNLTNSDRELIQKQFRTHDPSGSVIDLAVQALTRVSSDLFLNQTSIPIITWTNKSVNVNIRIDENNVQYRVRLSRLYPIARVSIGYDGLGDVDIGWRRDRFNKIIKDDFRLVYDAEGFIVWYLNRLLKNEDYCVYFANTEIFDETMVWRWFKRIRLCDCMFDMK